MLAMLKVSHLFAYLPLLANKSFKAYPGQASHWTRRVDGTKHQLISWVGGLSHS